MNTTRDSARIFGELVASSEGKPDVQLESSEVPGEGSQVELDEEEESAGAPADSSGDADDGPDGDQQDDDQEILPKDVQYDIVRNERRRLVLKYLHEEENPVSVGKLSEYVAGIENDKEPRMLDSQERKRAYVGLYQCHLPRMEDAGVIDYNKSRGVVEKGQHAEEVVQHIASEENLEQVWAKRYLLCSLVGVGGYGATIAAGLGTGWLGPAVLVACLGAVSVVAGAQLHLAGESD